MTKKILKNVLKYTILTYAILTMFYIIFNYFQYAKALENATHIPTTNEMHEETISLQEGENIENWLEKRYYAGKMSIITENISIFVVSIFISCIIVGIKNAKESSIIRYILAFIAGNIIFVICTVILLYLMKYIDFSKNFFDVYRENFKITILPYSILFLVIVIIKRYIYKLSVEKINEMLKSKKNK